MKSIEEVVAWFNQATTTELDALAMTGAVVDTVADPVNKTRSLATRHDWELKAVRHVYQNGSCAVVALAAVSSRSAEVWRLGQLAVYQAAGMAPSIVTWYHSLPNCHYKAELAGAFQQLLAADQVNSYLRCGRNGYSAMQALVGAKPTSRLDTLYKLCEAWQKR